MMSDDDSSSVNPDAFDKDYCLALFRRAWQQSDPLAKCALEQNLKGTVLLWTRLHPRREAACRFEEEVTYLRQAFERFWDTMAHHSEECSTFDTILQYLQISLNSVLMDTLRTHLRPKEAEPNSPRESAVAARQNGDEVWERIRASLSDGHEERLAYLLFHCGLKPGEIVRSYPQECSSEQEILYVRRKIMEHVLRE